MDVALVHRLRQRVHLLPGPGRRLVHQAVDGHRPPVRVDPRRHLGGEHRPVRADVVLPGRQNGGRAPCAPARRSLVCRPCGATSLLVHPCRLLAHDVNSAIRGGVDGRSLVTYVSRFHCSGQLIRSTPLDMWVSTGQAGTFHRRVGFDVRRPCSTAARYSSRGERIVANASTPPDAQMIPAIRAARWKPAESSAGPHTRPASGRPRRQHGDRQQPATRATSLLIADAMPDLVVRRHREHRRGQ